MAIVNHPLAPFFPSELLFSKPLNSPVGHLHDDLRGYAVDQQLVQLASYHEESAAEKGSRGVKKSAGSILVHKGDTMLHQTAALGRLE
jgi:hypothetical protein